MAVYSVWHNWNRRADYRITGGIVSGIEADRGGNNSGIHSGYFSAFSDILDEGSGRCRRRLLFYCIGLLPRLFGNIYAFYLRSSFLRNLWFGNGGMGISLWHQRREDASAVFAVCIAGLAVDELYKAGLEIVKKEGNYEKGKKIMYGNEDETK